MTLRKGDLFTYISADVRALCEGTHVGPVSVTVWRRVPVASGGKVIFKIPRHSPVPLHGENEQRRVGVVSERGVILPSTDETDIEHALDEVRAAMREYARGQMSDHYAKAAKYDAFLESWATVDVAYLEAAAND